MKEELYEDRQIHNRLVHTWYAFFQRFGRLTPVQRRAIPLILDGEDLLVCAATASGKTEAACVPLIDRYIDRDEAWTILYISPTRALVNDLYQRLGPPVSSLGLQIQRRTGEYKSNLSRPPHLLLTTPESFDSMLCRGKLPNQFGHLLAHVVAVVLDEVHLFHGTARGEQIRWLIERLRRLRAEAQNKRWSKSKDVQIIALSATVPEPDEILKAYLPSGKKLIHPGQREIEAEIRPVSQRIDHEIAAYIRNLDRPAKILLFCNSRQRVDHLSSLLNRRLEKDGYQVYPHHGSLSKRLREEAEEAIRYREKVLIVATSTLELGIDIGDIDLVMLDDPAPDIPSFLQRIGRGNRRTNRTRVILFSSTYLNQFIHKAMVEAAKISWLGTGVKGKNYAVIRQQIFSYIFQSPTRYRNRDKLIRFVNHLSEDEIGTFMIDYLLDREELVEDERGICLSEEWLDKGIRGMIHSNIEGSYGYEIIDERSGERIAKDVNYNSGNIIQVAGKIFNIRTVTDRNIAVQPLKGDASFRKPEEIKGDWSYFPSGNKSTEHALILRWYLKLEKELWPRINTGSDTLIFHLGGVRRRLLLELLREIHRLDQKIWINNCYIRYESQQINELDWLRFPPPEALRKQIGKKLNYLEKNLGRPIANADIPKELRIKEIESWLNLDEERKIISQVNITDQIPDEIKEIFLKNDLPTDD